METIDVNEKKEVLVADYLKVIGDKRMDDLTYYLTDDVEFIGPKATMHGVQNYIATMKRLGTILLRNEIKKIFIDGNEACVIYDFVTDTQVGPVASVEWLKFKNGKISSIRLIFDNNRWPEVVEEMNKRLKN